MPRRRIVSPPSTSDGPGRRCDAALPLAIAVLAFACASPGPPEPPRACSAAGAARPRFDRTRGACDCVPAAPGAWQSAAPRDGSDSVRENEPARVALRRIGTADFREKEVEAEVLAPSGGVASGVGVLAPPEWIVLRYPQDFPLGAYHRAGLYTILWKIDEDVVACDGFAIEPGEPPAAAPAPGAP